MSEETEDCRSCAFEHDHPCSAQSGRNCQTFERKDGRNVIFVPAPKAQEALHTLLKTGLERMKKEMEELKGVSVNGVAAGQIKVKPSRYDDLIKSLKAYQEPLTKNNFDDDYVYANPTVCEEAVIAIQTLLLENESLRKQVDKPPNA